MLSLTKVLKALTQRSWPADHLIDTVKRGMAMRAYGNLLLAVLISRRVSLVIVSAVCSLRQLFIPVMLIGFQCSESPGPTGGELGGSLTNSMGPESTPQFKKCVSFLLFYFLN